MRELWTGRVELLTPPTEWGDTKCFTNVFAWADGPEDFATIIDRNLKSEGIAVLNIEEPTRLRATKCSPKKPSHFSIGYVSTLTALPPQTVTTIRQGRP